MSSNLDLFSPSPVVSPALACLCVGVWLFVVVVASPFIATPPARKKTWSMSLKSVFAGTLGIQGFVVQK